MPSNYGKDVDRIFAYLKKKIPLQYPIKLKTATSFRIKDENLKILRKDDEGHYVFTGEIHIISIKRGKSFESAVAILLHEYAHAVYCETDVCKNWREPHPNEWGKAYDKVYRVYEEYIAECIKN